MNFKVRDTFAIMLLMVFALSSCSKTQSYSDLLKNEQKVSNWFLAQQTVCNVIPSDSVFEEGSDAPFYRMDDDGYVYMQVVKCDRRGERDIPETGDQVYFTFTRYNIDTMYKSDTLDVEPEASNQDDLLNTIGNTYFLFNNYRVNVSNDFGSGIQLPVSYLGYNSEVNILLKSYYGFQSENTTCIPYLVNVRYFKAEY
ncbi:MAG: DUF4827 domain-containing protein [Muribaculaceae bacterium]|nr:DUF4827 domain-containing protein [Muribaculaceae bacterium]